MKKDSTGRDILLFHTVIVPEPNDTDIHIHEFTGTVVDNYNNGTEYVTVEDGDGDCFMIESERLTIIDAE